MTLCCSDCFQRNPGTRHEAIFFVDGRFLCSNCLIFIRASKVGFLRKLLSLVGL